MCNFLLSKEYHPLFKGMNKYNILHPFQGNLHKGMLHWSLKEQLLIEEYPFKIMLYFLQGTLYFFKWQFHALRFITDTSPSFKGIVVYMKGFPFVQQLTVNHTILSHTLSLGLLCVLKATSQRDATYF